MISQHWFRWWLGANRQQAITWANVDPDLCRQMASLGLNELNSNLVKSHSSLTSQLSSRFAIFPQSTAVILPCFAQNFKTVGLLKRMWWANEILRDLSLRCVSEGWPLLHSNPGFMNFSNFLHVHKTLGYFIPDNKHFPLGISWTLSITGRLWCFLCCLKAPTHAYQ